MSAVVLDPSAVERLLRIGGAKLAGQMIGLFLQHGPERVGLAEAGFAADDMRQIEMSAHSLKSSAGNVGATRLQHAATDLEAFVLGQPLNDTPLSELVAAIRREYDAAAAQLTIRLAEIAA